MENSFTSVNFGHSNRGIQIQHSNAPIEASFHYPPEPEEPTPAPYAAIGFSRDPSFVDRGDLLDRISAQCSEPSSRVAIWGLGGVGKSQLAIEFAHRLAESSTNLWIFWVHANTQARALEDFSSIANKAKLAGRKAPDANIPKLVCDWLSNPHNGKWFLVLDSADDPDVFFTSISKDGTGHNFAECLPQSPNGSILITTRNKDLAMKLINEHQNIHLLGPMTDQEASSLLEKRLGSLSDASIAADLVRSLDLVPLAISQAAAYIRRRTPRTSLTQYLADFRKSEKKRIELLSEDSGDPRRDLRQDGAASNSVLTTWQFSFEHIRSKRPSAAELLSLMSFFNRQGIPEFLLKAGERSRCNEGPPVYDDSSDSDSQNSDQQFEIDIEILRNYSLITQSNEEQLFEMHEIVQLAMRSWLKAQNLQERSLGVFITTMENAFPEPDFDNWALCGKLFPHVEAAALYKPKVQCSKKAFVILMKRGSTYAQQHDRFLVAEQMALRSVSIGQTLDEAVPGGDFRSTDLLVLLYLQQRRIREAEELQAPLVERLKSSLGSDHPTTLMGMSRLSEIYIYQDRFREAEELGLYVMKHMETRLGPDHQYTLSNLSVLADTYTLQSRYQEAEKFHKRVFENRKKILGIINPLTLESMYKLAQDYNLLRQFEDAENLLRELVKLSESIFGAEHSDTLESMGLLGQTYNNTGRPKEAEKICMAAIAAHKRMSTEDLYTFLTIRLRLVVSYSLQNRLEEAEKLGVEVVEAYKRKFGAGNAFTLDPILHLGIVYLRKGQLGKAEELLTQAMEGYKEAFGVEHALTIQSITNLAHTLRLQGHQEAADALEQGRGK